MQYKKGLYIHEHKAIFSADITWKKQKNKKIGVKRMNRVPVKAMKSGFSDWMILLRKRVVFKSEQ
jgi:hypothetical protein